MKTMVRVGDGRMSVLVSATLLCLSGSWVCLLHSQSAEAQGAPGDGSSGEEANVQTCENGSLELSAEKGTVFTFKCKDGSKLYPVEQDQPVRKTEIDALNKVFVFTSESASAGKCGTSEQQLSVLVPKSKLEVTQKEEDNIQKAQKANPVYRLTLGPAQETARHLCYTCNSTDKPVQLPTRSDQQECTIYITVPKKAEEESQPPVPPQDSQQQDPQSPSPPQQQDPQPDQPSGSETSSSVFGWAFMTLATSALACLFHM